MGERTALPLPAEHWWLRLLPLFTGRGLEGNSMKSVSY